MFCIETVAACGGTRGSSYLERMQSGLRGEREASFFLGTHSSGPVVSSETTVTGTPLTSTNNNSLDYCYLLKEYFQDFFFLSNSNYNNAECVKSSSIGLIPWWWCRDSFIRCLGGLRSGALHRVVSFSNTWPKSTGVSFLDSAVTLEIMPWPRRVLEIKQTKLVQ